MGGFIKYIMLHNRSLQRNATVLLLFLLALTQGAFIGMTVSTNNTEINLNAQYTFTLNRQYDPVNFNFIPSPTPVTLNARIALTFPQQFSTISSTTAIPCTNPAGNDLGCTLNAPNRTVFVNNYFNTSATLSDNIIIVKMTSIVNAFISGPSGNFYWQIIDANGSVIDQGPPVTTTTYPTAITFTGGTFASCGIAASGAYVSTASTLTLSLTPKNQIPAGGQLIIGIPSSWSSDPVSQSTIPTTPSCVQISGIGTTNLACTYNSQNQQLTVTGFTSSLSSAFSLSVSTVLTPPTVGSGQSISVYSQWSDGTAIDSCSALVTGLVAAPFQAISLTSNDNSTVQSPFTATLSLTLSRAFFYTDTIQLILPTQFLSVSVSSVNFATITRTPNLNTLTLSNFPSVPATITSNNVLTFTLSNITNALSAAPLTLQVKFFRSNQLYQTSSASYSASVATLTSFSISATSNFVQAVGSATLTLDSVRIFPLGSVIIITYPASVTASDAASTAVTRCSLNGTIVASATFSVVSNQIIIRNVFASNFAGTVSIILPTFANPPTTQPSSYLLSVTDSASYGVFTSSYTFQANTKALLSNTLAASSYTVLATLVTYTLSINTNFPFTAIAITVPPQVSIGTGYANTCAPNNFSSCTLNGQNLTFIGTLGSGSYQLSWGYNTNPNSLQPTSSFQVTTYYQGWPVEQSQGVIILTMTSTASFTTFVAYPSSYSNSNTVTVTLDLTAPSGAPSGTLTATFPSQLGLSSASCTSCIIVPPQVIFTIAAGVTTHSLTVSNVQNVGSFKPISSFSAAVSNPSSYLSLSSSAPGWTNTQPSSFSTAVAGSNNYRGEANTFLFSLSGLSSAQTKVNITINSAFPALSSAPTGATFVDSHTLSYPCSGASCSISISLTNPTALGSYTFAMTSWTVDNYQVGTSVSNSWTYSCSGTECRSCHSNSSCIDCYNSSVSSFSIFNTNSSACTSACSSGFFLVGSTCTPCDSNCTACISASTNCTACPSSYFLDLVYDICVPSCLSGYFANAGNQQCNGCTPPCLTCTTTATNCLSCTSGTYLHNNQCLGSCPSGSHIANPATSNCDACSSNCLTCGTTTTNCLTCDNALPLYFQNNKCVSACSSQYYLVLNICTFCNTPCKTCGSSVSACTSCYINSSSPVYYNSLCISASQCPTGHYVNSTNSSCEPCPSQCTSCSSPTVCTVCALNFYLSGSSCLSSCPNTSYPFSNTTSGYCLPCNSCATCSDASTCTSCPVSQFLYQAICYSTCPAGSYPSSSICLACNSNCPTCQNSTFCLTCISTHYLYLGVCYSTCPSGTHSNSTVCSACPSSCLTCTSQTVCLTCAASYSLENSQCVLVCSVGVSVNQVCMPCGLNCNICNATTGVCSQCVPPYLLYNNTCLTTCPSTHLTNDNLTCVPCSNNFVNCSTCSSSLCLSCSYGQLLSGSCQPCNPGTYDLSGSCALCPSTCTTCTGPTTCQTCATGNYLQGTICSATCPQNMVPNGTICSQCLPQCQICNLTNSLCSVCNAGLYLHNNLCFTSCPSPLVISYDFLTCVTEQVYYQQFSQAAKIIPFPFTIGSIVLIIIGIVLRCFYRDMHLQTALCALVGVVQLATWVIFLLFEYIYWQNFHPQSAMGVYCALAALLLLVAFNFIHLKFYFKYAVSDEEFSKWHKKYGCTNCFVLTTATLLTFKFYRLVHSKFLGRNQLSMVLQSVNKLVPFSLLGVLSLFFCSVPICVGCALALYNSISTDQEFFIALDTLVVTGIMALLILMDLRHADDYFYDQHEAHNLKKKIYQEDSFKFESLHGGSSQNGSTGNIQHIDQVQGEMAGTGQKFKSTFQHTKRVSQVSHAQLKAAQLQGQQQQFQFDESEGDQNMPSTSKKAMWEPVKYDRHGYQIRHDSLGNTVLYDQNGYRVQIDQDGNHKLYNQDGNQVRIVQGKHLVFDKDGNQLIDGKPHDERGYEIREEDGQKVFYDKNGFKVVGYPPDEKHIDQQGNICVQDQQGRIRKYNEDGFEIVDYKGKKLLKNSQGQFVRKNQQGQYEMYDPEDGFTLKANQQTGQMEKYDQYGFRIEKDAFGTIRRYDQDGFLVTVIPGGLFVRHDKDGYRVEKDQQGNIHRYDEQGYELVTDSEGITKFIDKHGYRVERDLYGRVSLFDDQGLLVVIDPDTGKERRFNEEGLEVTTDVHGNRVLLDKRGKVVRELEDGQTYEKYDTEGNKIYLDQNGYQVQYDSDGNVVLYDKIGERVDSEYDIMESEDGDNFQSTLMDQKGKKKYRYKATKAVDNQAQLQQLMSVQPFMFEEESEISELKEFHDQDPPHVEVDHEYEKMVIRERNALQVKDQNQGEQLVDFQQSEELDEVHDVDIGLRARRNRFASKALRQQNGKQEQYDKQALLRGLDEKQPDQALLQARRKQLNRILNTPRDQEHIEMKSVADVGLNQRSFDNEGVQPMENKTQYSQLDSIDELEVPLGKTKRGNAKKTAQTVYNFNTVDVQIKNKNRLYDEEEQIQSLHQDQWNQQQPVFARERVKEGSSNANTNILYVQEEEDNKDALSDYVQHQSQTKGKTKPMQRYPQHNDLFSGKSIEQIEEQLFEEVDPHTLRERREFKLSGAPNPLVEYAKAMESNRKSLQERMYLEGVHKKK